MKRRAGARSGGAARHSPGPIRALREKAGQGVVHRAGPLSHERLLGADPLRLSGRDGEGVCRRGGDRRRGRDHRPPRADLRPQSVRLRSQALPGAVGAEARCAGPAAPLQSWNLPEAFQRIRRLLESRMGNRGKKEFIQILRLLEVFEEAIVAAGVVQAMQLGAISFDAVKQLVLARIEQRPARLDLTRYPYLPTAEVRTTAAADYAALLSRSAA